MFPDKILKGTFFTSFSLLSRTIHSCFFLLYYLFLVRVMSQYQEPINFGCVIMSLRANAIAFRGWSAALFQGQLGWYSLSVMKEPKEMIFSITTTCLSMEQISLATPLCGCGMYCTSHLAYGDVSPPSTRLSCLFKLLSTKGNALREPWRDACENWKTQHSVDSRTKKWKTRALQKLHLLNMPSRWAGASLLAPSPVSAQFPAHLQEQPYGGSGCMNPPSPWSVMSEIHYCASQARGIPIATSLALLHLAEGQTITKRLFLPIHSVSVWVHVYWV